MGKLRWYFASCALGLEALLAGEVEAAGGQRIRQDRGGITFQGEREVGYRLVLWSRVASRVLEELGRMRIRGPDDLYTLASRIHWRRWIHTDQTFAVFASVSGRRVRHSMYAALKVKDALVDQLRREQGERPSVDREDPDLPLKLAVLDDVATLSRDLAGGSLHRRGWRPVSVEAPLNEALAAGLLQLAAWDRATPLCDPMCGSGTLLIEAAHLAGDRAPGLHRDVALLRWIDADRALWSELLQEAEARWAVGRGMIPPLMGNDRDPVAIAIARDSAERAGVADAITLHTGPIADYQPPIPPAMVVVNPPYGVRLDPEDLEQGWTELGRFLKGLGQGTAWILSSDPELSRRLWLRTSQRIPIRNGGLDCRWMRYTLRP